MQKVYVVYREWKEDRMRDLMSVHSTQDAAEEICLLCNQKSCAYKYRYVELPLL